MCTGDAYTAQPGAGVLPGTRRTYLVRNTMTVLTIGSLFAVAALSCVAGDRVRRSPQGIAAASSGSGAGSFAYAGGSTGGAFAGPGFPGFPGFPPQIVFPQPPIFDPYGIQAIFQRMGTGFPTGSDVAASSVSVDNNGAFGGTFLGPDVLTNRFNPGGFEAPLTPVNQGPSSPGLRQSFSSSSMMVTTDENGNRVVKKKTVIGGNKDGKIYYEEQSS